jgi:hypothetical protein
VGHVASAADLVRAAEVLRRDGETAEMLAEWEGWQMGALRCAHGTNRAPSGWASPVVPCVALHDVMLDVARYVALELGLVEQRGATAAAREVLEHVLTAAKVVHRLPSATQAAVAQCARDWGTEMSKLRVGVLKRMLSYDAGTGAAAVRARVCIHVCFEGLRRARACACVSICLFLCLCLCVCVCVRVEYATVRF